MREILDRKFLSVPKLRPQDLADKVACSPDFGQSQIAMHFFAFLLCCHHPSRAERCQLHGHICKRDAKCLCNPETV